jgi:hypothetical protein
MHQPIPAGKVVSFKEKLEWTLTAKYNIGKKPSIN